MPVCWRVGHEGALLGRQAFETNGKEVPKGKSFGLMSG